MQKFEHRSPSHQNAIDLFKDHWASKIESVFPAVISGPAPMFTREDRRPAIAAEHLGLVANSLQGMNVLELGPLEGAHTYQLASLGANSILAIEANNEAFLKCLIVKEILQIPRCRFLLGDCLKFLKETSLRFDLIFCSGVLYHMENPFDLIKAMSLRSDRIFLWTHYFHSEKSIGPARRPRQVVCDDLELTFYEQDYGDTSYAKFWGGLKPTAAWLELDAIEKCFTQFGYQFSVRENTLEHPGGPNISATAFRA